MILDNSFLEEQKKALEEKKTRLEAELGNLGTKDTKHQIPNAEYDVTYDDVGTDVGETDENVHEREDYQNKSSAAAVLEENLRQVKRALERIENGTYGMRPDGTVIPRDRLKAVPEATE